MTQNTSPAVMQQRSEPHAEQWLPVSDWFGYEVSDQGRVRSWKQRAKGRVWVVDRSQPPRILKPEPRNGYLSVRLSEKGRTARHENIHRLVLEAFVGPAAAGIHAAHGNGDGTDNRLANLRWATPSANNQDKVAHGTHQSGDRAGTAKLTWADVESIRSQRVSGAGVQSLARQFGVCRNTITSITTGRTWIAPCRKKLERKEDYL
jgi:hypothetical protein